MAPRTRNRYCQAHGRFAELLPTFSLMLSCIDDLDLLLSKYVQHLWEEGDTRCWANDCIAAIQYYIPDSKRRLPLSWSLIQAWGRLELPALALPFDPFLLGAFCGGLL